MRLFDRFAGTVEQIRELPELYCGEVAQLAAVQFVHWFIQFLQQAEPLRGDASFDHTPVLHFARSNDQSAGFHAVEQACDVRIARNETAADLAAGQAFFSSASQDSQDVVLRSGEAVGLEQGLSAACQGVSSAHKAHKDAGLEGSLRIAFRFRGSLHVQTILVITTIVKRNVAPVSAGNSGDFARRYVLRVGRMCTSLMKLPAAWVTRDATACAMSSG